MFAEEFGRPPTSKEWQLLASARAAPGLGAAQRHFGSWSAALRAAGLSPTKPRVTAEELQAVVEAWEASRSVRGAAERLGISARTAGYRLRVAGVRQDSGQPRLTGFRMKRYPVEPAIRWEVWERDDFRCQRCGAQRYLSIDHVVPVAGGGTNAIENLRTLCQPCNAGKKDREEAAT